MIGGVPAGSEVRVRGATEVGLGDDALLALRPLKGQVEIIVRRGLGRDARCRFGGRVLRLEGVEGEFRFEAGWVLFAADPERDLLLDGQRCTAPIELLSGDVMEVEGRRVEVLG